MKNRKLFKNAVNIYASDIVDEMMKIINQDDERGFDEKKQDLIAYLNREEDALREEGKTDNENGVRWDNEFWSFGDIAKTDKGVLIKKVSESDRDEFIELQKETLIMKSMLKEKKYCDDVWNEHIRDSAMVFSIEVDGEYAGFCGINNLNSEIWEIAIELRKKWRNKGVGYDAVKTMLSQIKERLNVKEFFVRIEADNYASQKLFEKLGAKPYGIEEFLLHKEEDIARCEEEFLDDIDDDLIEVVKKFNVEPKKLLSHVLKYKLLW